MNKRGACYNARAAFEELAGTPGTRSGPGRSLYVRNSMDAIGALCLGGIVLAVLSFTFGAVCYAPRLPTLESQLKVWVLGLSFALFLLEIILLLSVTR